MDVSFKKMLENELLKIFIITVIFLTGLVIIPILFSFIGIIITPVLITQPNYYMYYGNNVAFENLGSFLLFIIVMFLFIPFSFIFPMITGIVYSAVVIFIGSYVSKKLYIKIKRTRRQKNIRTIVMIIVGSIVFFMFLFLTNWSSYFLYIFTLLFLYNSFLYYYYVLTIHFTAYYIIMSTFVMLSIYISGLLVDVAFYLYRKKKHYKLKKIPVEYEYFTPEGKKKYLKKKEEKEKQQTPFQRVLYILGIISIVLFAFLFLNFLVTKPSKMYFIIDDNTKMNIPDDIIIEVNQIYAYYTILDQPYIPVSEPPEMLSNYHMLLLLYFPFNISRDSHSICYSFSVPKMIFFKNPIYYDRDEHEYEMYPSIMLEMTIYNKTTGETIASPLSAIVSNDKTYTAFNDYNSFVGFLSKYIVINEIEVFSEEFDAIFFGVVFDAFNVIDFFT